MSIFEATFPSAQEEVAEAYENVSFFRRHMDDAGLHPRDLRTPADFRRLPATAKVDYRRNFPTGVLAKGATLSDPFVFRSQSSGTTGERLLTIAHTFDLAERMTTTAGAHPGMQAVFAAARPQRVCRYAAPNCSDVECATPFTTSESRTLFDGTRVLPVAHDLLATPKSMVDQAVAEITDYDPHWLYTDPMHLAFLSRELSERDLAPPPAGGAVLTYNLVTQIARRQVDRVFRDSSIVVEVVSMSELGWMGMECPEGFVHMNAQSFYLELLVGDRPAEPGELAEMYVTSIGDQISPHLRYNTGDIYTLLGGDCACGHEFPRIVFEGRGRDVIRRDGAVRLTPKGLDRLVGDPGWLELYKLRQLADDRYSFRYIPAEGADHTDAAKALGEQVQELLGADARLTVDAVDYIECERSGKFLPCVSDVES